MPRLSRPSPKMRKFVKAYLDGSTRPEAIAIAGYSHKDSRAAHVIAHDLLKKPMVQEEIEQVLIRRGLSTDYIASNLEKIINAGVERTETATADSALRGLDMLARMHDLYPSERKVSDNRSITYNYNNMSLDQLKDKLNQLEEDSRRYLDSNTGTTEAVETSGNETKPL